MPLQDYFQPENVTAALDAYAAAAGRLNWPISRKLALYALAQDAFASNLAGPERLRAFTNIYNELQRYWKIFRNSGSGYWDADTLYRVLTTACGAVARTGGLTLLNVSAAANRDAVLQCLRELRLVKQTAGYPHMAVAKFLHFFNPHFIPIYDGAVIWESVLWGRPKRPAAFRNEYTQFCNRRTFNPREGTERFNWNYVLLASELMKSTDTLALMNAFADWVRTQAGVGADARVLNALPTYYATAFEFIAIGAAELELQTRWGSGI